MKSFKTIIFAKMFATNNLAIDEKESVDLQLITGIEDFATQLLKRVYRVYPFEKIRQFVQHFRIIPTVSVNPVSSEVDIAFQPASSPAYQLCFPGQPGIIDPEYFREEKITILSLRDGYAIGKNSAKRF